MQRDDTQVVEDAAGFGIQNRRLASRLKRHHGVLGMYRVTAAGAGNPVTGLKLSDIFTNINNSTSRGIPPAAWVGQFSESSSMRGITPSRIALLMTCRTRSGLAAAPDQILAGRIRSMRSVPAETSDAAVRTSTVAAPDSRNRNLLNDGLSIIQMLEYLLHVIASIRLYSIIALAIVTDAGFMFCKRWHEKFSQIHSCQTK